MNSRPSANPALEFYVYAHRRVDSGAIFYVGKGHGKRAWSRHGRNSYWKRVSEKHGFEPLILKQHLGEDEAFALEEQTIAFYRSVGIPLTNLTDGGEGPCGRVFSDETKEKMRSAKIGRKLSAEHVAKIVAANTGKRRSDETRAKLSREFTAEHRAKLSAAAAGRVMSPDSIEKTAKKLRGRRHSSAHKAQIGASLKGARNPNFNANTFRFFHPEHGARICTQSALRAEFGMSHGNLSKLASGKIPVAWGWTVKGAQS